MLVQLLQPWQNFYLLLGTAAATLVGLMFVAVSLGVGLSVSASYRSTESIHTFITPTISNFMLILLLSAVALMPLGDMTPLSWLLTALTTWRIAALLWGLQRIFRHHGAGLVDLNHWIWHAVLPSACCALLAVATTGLFTHDPRALHGVALAALGWLVIGVHNAWVLVVWLLEQRAKTLSGAKAD